MTGATIDDAGAQLGHAVWLERRAFEILGAWVRDTTDAAARLAFAAQRRHHGWRAGLLEPCLPSTRDHDPPALVAPLDDAWRARVDEWGDATGDERVQAARSLLTAALEHAEGVLGALGPVADGPARRVVRIAADDARADLATLDALDRAR